MTPASASSSSPFASSHPANSEQDRARHGEEAAQVEPVRAAIERVAEPDRKRQADERRHERDERARLLGRREEEQRGLDALAQDADEGDGCEADRRSLGERCAASCPRDRCGSSGPGRRIQKIIQTRSAAATIVVIPSNRYSEVPSSSAPTANRVMPTRRADGQRSRDADPHGGEAVAAVAAIEEREHDGDDERRLESLPQHHEP